MWVPKRGAREANEGKRTPIGFNRMQGREHDFKGGVGVGPGP